MLNLFLADDLWEALQDENDQSERARRRDVWAFCPACQTTLDFSLSKRRFAKSSSSDLIRDLMRKAEEESS